MHDSLLVRHFLRRFLDNDLLSPNADQHDVMAAACAALVAPGLAATVLLSFKYQFFFSPPGVTSLLALDDRVLYFGCSMTIMALVAAVTWDALSLDARDTAILGTLPVSRWAIARAKAAAVVLFASAFAIALNLLPSLMYPALLPGRTLPVGPGGFLLLILAHGFISALSGAFGFLAVLTFRELLRAMFGSRWSGRVSAMVRGALVVFLATVFLLLPVLASDVARLRLSPPSAAPAVMPPLWFLGLHETIAGGVLDGLPRENLRAFFRQADTQATATYRGYAPLFRRLAGAAITASAVLLMIALAAYAWNSRRPVVVRGTRHRRSHSVVAARRCAPTAGSSAAGQGRVFLRAADALPQCAASPLGDDVGGVGPRDRRGDSARRGRAARADPARGVRAADGVDHHVRDRLPPWGAPARRPARQLALHHVVVRRRASLPVRREAGRAGATDAADTLVLLPVHVVLLGPAVAAAHFACGLLIGILLLELLLLDLRRLPFVSSFARPRKTCGDGRGSTC